MVKNLKKKRIAISILVVLVLCTLVGGTGAKYVYEKYGRKLFGAKEFYFESNLLKDYDVEYILNPTASSITFTVSNSIDELRYAEDDIRYGVRVNDQVIVSNETLEKNVLSSDEVTINNLEKGKSYEVVAIGRAGYVKYLKAKFTVSDTDKNVFKDFVQRNGYVELTVWTENLTGPITIEYPAGLIPDGSDDVLRNVHNYSADNGYTSGLFVDDVNFGKVYSTKTYRFFVEGNGSYSVNSFTVYKKEGEQKILASDEKLK